VPPSIAVEETMLRSMIVGLAIAAMLQFATRTTVSSDVTLAAQQIDWVQIQTKALTTLLGESCALFTR
jgi:hypothetical protein